MEASETTHQPGTVFYLHPLNLNAIAIVYDNANRQRRCRVPGGSEQVLRIGTDQAAKIPSRLVTMGRLPAYSDILLRGEHFSNTDQCYFDLHSSTGELLLHDTSKNENTELLTDKKKISQIVQRPRQCVVDLELEWLFHIGEAQFRLKPSNNKPAQLTAERQAFIQNIPEEYVTSKGLQSGLSVAAAKSHSHYRDHIKALNGNNTIKWARRRELGSGGQGQVHLVVDLHTGEHYALKTLHQQHLPGSEIAMKLLEEINLVQSAAHDHIVPYLSHQGQTSEQNFEIFMPVYEGNLSERIMQLRTTRQHKATGPDNVEEPDPAKDMMYRMLRQILDALEHIHSLNIIHRDIKPSNILFRGDHWAITDFGISKKINNTSTTDTTIATMFYAAPEIHQKSKQTPMIDIYGLGLCVLECFVSLDNVEKGNDWLLRHRQFQLLAKQHAPLFCQYMLADTAKERPTARGLLDALISRPELHALPGNWQTTMAWGVGMLQQGHGTAMSYSTTPSDMNLAPTAATANLQPAQMQTETGFQPAGFQPMQPGFGTPKQPEQESQHPQPGPVAVSGTKRTPDPLIEPSAKRRRDGRSVESGQLAGSLTTTTSTGSRYSLRHSTRKQKK